MVQEIPKKDRERLALLPLAVNWIQSATGNSQIES
jgi:hypothetical protein